MTRPRGYFDIARPVPRYHGISDPIPVAASQAVADMARNQALHRAWLDWATSAERDHWLPGPTVDLRVVDDVGELFVRNQRAITATATGSPVYDSDELARMDAALEAVRDDG